MFGFLNIYKPQGITSHDVVAKLRKITGIKQIGHTGTLDPFAEGVLPICIGKATRLIEYLSDDKAYRGVIKFGAKTTTYDREGEIVAKSDEKITEATILKYLEAFKGEIEQTPPIYSAIKIKGKKLYEYARVGEEVKIPTRKVSIEKIELVDFNEAAQECTLEIECSKGTYIRSIANDLGEKCGVGGYLTQLIRTKAGDFKINKSIKLEDLTKENVEEKIISPLEILSFPHIRLNNRENELIQNGMKINLDKESKEIKTDELIILIYGQELRAIGRIDEGIIIPEKVFH